MFCPQCSAEYHDGSIECPDCRVALAVSPADEGEAAGEVDLDVLIRTGLTDPVSIGFVKILLEEAGIPFFAMDQNIAARQESGNVFGWWSFRVPRDREAEAREILRGVTEMK